MVYVLFVIGVGLLIAGAEALVRGASRLAAGIGISPLVIGLTVVAFGTSSPELTVSVLSALEGQAGADIALGNVVGSNIFNVLFILGVSAVITPLAVAQKLVRIDVPVMIGLSVFVLALAIDGAIGRMEGAVLFLGIVAYTVFAIAQGRKESSDVANEYDKAFDSEGLKNRSGKPKHRTGELKNRSEGPKNRSGEPRNRAAGPKQRTQKPKNRSGKSKHRTEKPKNRLVLNITLIAAGLAMLVVGSRWLVGGAVAMAEGFGVSELVISLTIVAAGTSLPEVATSILASMRGQRDIAVGNVVGSNIFNVLAVLGLSAVVAPAGIGVSQAAVAFDIPVMIAATVVCLPIFFTGSRIGRPEGLLFLLYYAAYLGYVILAASQHDALPIFSDVMLFFTVPATLIILLVSVIRQARRKRSEE